MDEDKVFDLDNVPDDAELFNSKNEYDPIDPTEMYQLEIQKVELRENPFYKPNAEKKADQGSKYQFNFEFVILDDGDFYGRRIWDTTSLAFKPDGKRGATKLYKIVMAALKLKLNWDEVEAYAPDLKTFYKNLKENVVGKQVKVAIENKTMESGKLKTKVVTYSEIKKGKELPAFDQDKASKVAEEVKARKRNAKAKADSEPDPTDSFK